MFSYHLDLLFALDHPLQHEENHTAVHVVDQLEDLQDTTSDADEFDIRPLVGDLVEPVFGYRRGEERICQYDTELQHENVACFQIGLDVQQGQPRKVDEKVFIIQRARVGEEDEQRKIPVNDGAHKKRHHRKVDVGATLRHDKHGDRP